MPTRTPAPSTRPPRLNATDLPARTQVILRPSTSCGAALAACIHAAHTDISAARLIVLETHEPSGPHQLRVAIRRLRSALRAFRPLASTATTRKLDAHAKAIADAVAPLREADVLLHETCNIGDTNSDTGHAALHAALQAHRDAQASVARSTLNSEAWGSLHLYLSLAAPAVADHPALQSPLSAHADKTIQQRWRKLEAAGEGFANQTTDERHAFRLQLKKLRYTIDVFKPLFAALRTSSEQMKAFQTRLKVLQETFGYLNDVAQAARLTVIVTEIALESDASADHATQRLACLQAGYVQGWHAARAEHEWHTARRRWKRLRGAPRFWR